MDTNKHIAIPKVGDFITTRVLDIHYNMILPCDRECLSLGEASNGSVKCDRDTVKKMVNFQAKALLIDYEVILDKKADDDEYISHGDFLVIDEDGHIHQGETICERMLIADKGVDTGTSLYPGTRATFRIFYESFPSNQKVTSIVLEYSGYDSARIHFDEASLPEYESQEKPQPKSVDVPIPPDYLERIEALELEVRSLKRQMAQIQEKMSKPEYTTDDPRRPMSDPGIGYHPLDAK